MTADSRPRYRRASIFVALLLPALACLALSTAAAVAAPGSPGVPSPPGIAYAEEFENGVGATPVSLADYTGATGETYTAAPIWLLACNGTILQGASLDAAQGSSSCGSIGTYSAVRQLAHALGTHGGWANPQLNHAVTAFTEAPNPGGDLVQFETETPVPLNSNGRFLTLSLDAAAVNCHSNHALFKFYLLDGATQIPTFTTPIDPCTAAGGTTTPYPAIGNAPAGSARTGSYAADRPVLVSGSQFGIRMRNGQGSAGGNDSAFDNVRVLDVTPQLDKSFSPASVDLGQSSTLTFTVTNTNEVAVKEGWSFTDNLPAGLTVTGPAATTTCGGATVNAPAGAGSISVSGNLAAGQAACTVTVNVTATASGTYTNCAANLTLFGLNAPACAAVTFESADLAITKTTPATSVKPGDQLTYFLTAENKGPTTELVTLTDTLPTGLKYLSDDGGCDIDALPEIKCEIGMQAEGQSNTITVVTEVLATDGVIENTAKVSGALNPDPEPNNNESTATTPVEAVSDLAIEKTVSAPSAKPGEQLTYTLEVENKGPSTSNPTTVSDTLPPQLTYISDDSGCDTSALPLIECDLGAMAGGATATIEIVAEVVAAASGTIENTAEVVGPNFDPTPTDNEDTAATTIEPVSDLTLSKSVSSLAAEPGEQLTYTLAVENKGPSTSNPTTVSDTLPPQLTYISDDAGCDTSALPLIECDLGAMAGGATATIEIVAAIDADASGAIENTAVVAGPNLDPTPADNDDNATTMIEGSDLTISKTASESTVKPGDQLTYTLAVENKGPSTSNPTTVSDTLPPQLTYISDDSGCDTSALPLIECDLGAMAGGATATIEIVAEVVAAASGTIENTAEVVGPNFDPTPTDNEATASTTVSPLASDLALAKSAPGSAVKAGDEVTYTLVASNHGPDPSPQTVLTDTLPPSLSYVSDDAGCDTSALPEVECELGALADGESRTIHIVTTVASTDGQPIQNKARVSGANVDPELGNNPDAAQVPPVPVASPPSASPPAGPPPAAKPPKKPAKKRQGTPRLTLTKTASSARARPGAVISYRIEVANRGNAPAREVRVCDHPPATQRTLRTEPRADGKAEPCWRLAELAPGAERSFTLTAMVEPNSDGGTQRNRATVEAANVKGVRADTAAVGVKPLPQTGCLARPLGAGLLPEIELLC